MCRIIGIPARLIGGLTVHPSDLTGFAGDHWVAELYEPQQNRWVYIEPQGDICPFGYNQSWHIVFYSDEIEGTFPENQIHLNQIWSVGFWHYGYKETFKFEVKLIE